MWRDTLLVTSKYQNVSMMKLKIATNTYLFEIFRICDQRFILISGHLPVFEPSTIGMRLCWNYDKILSVLHKYTCVVAYFAGHDHDGGYAMDEHGIHHITFPGVVEGEIGQPDFGTCHVYEDRIELKGHGRVKNMTIELKTY